MVYNIDTMAKPKHTIQIVDPASASYENPLGPKDCSTLNDQLMLDAKFTGQGREPMVPRKGYPERQG